VFAVILEELDRHPLADGHEVEAPVAVEIDPNGIRNHAVRLRQLGQTSFVTSVKCPPSFRST